MVDEKECTPDELVFTLRSESSMYPSMRAVQDMHRKRFKMGNYFPEPAIVDWLNIVRAYTPPMKRDARKMGIDLIISDECKIEAARWLEEFWHGELNLNGGE